MPPTPRSASSNDCIVVGYPFSEAQDWVCVSDSSDSGQEQPVREVTATAPTALIPEDLAERFLAELFAEYPVRELTAMSTGPNSRILTSELFAPFSSNHATAQPFFLTAPSQSRTATRRSNTVITPDIPLTRLNTAIGLDSSLTLGREMHTEERERTHCVFCRDSGPLFPDPFLPTRFICSECGLRHRGVQDWNFIPEQYTIYGKASKNSLLFGVEVEIEDFRADYHCPHRNTIVWELSKKLPWLYGKHDGSLSNGFEIVSMPATWEFLQENLPSLQREFDDLSATGWRSFQTKTCGMHVHMSKSSFTSLHLFKFLKLFYSDPFFVFAVSQRGRISKVQRWASLTATESLMRMARTRVQRSDKYTAVNLRHESSVEVRIFRGTLSIQGFMKNLEFCKAMYDFTKETSLRELAVKDFIQYIFGSKQYPNLLKFFKENQGLRKYCENLLQ